MQMSDYAELVKLAREREAIASKGSEMAGKTMVSAMATAIEALLAENARLAARADDLAVQLGERNLQLATMTDASHKAWADLERANAEYYRLAARVAELTRERDEACRGLRQLADAGVAMSDHLKAANAKLAKAVEALRAADRRLHEDGYSVSDPVTRLVRATLTDLEASHDKG
jgi:chromosome segregation ATPase